MDQLNVIKNHDSDEDSYNSHDLTGVTKPIPLFVQVATQLINAIQTGQFPVGSRLPGEQSLARTFGVSRPSVREALSCLQFEGYIAPRRGSGTAVISTVERGHVAPNDTKGVKKVKYLDLLEARLLVEPLVVGLAASDPDPGALENLQRIVTGMQLTLSEPEMHAHTDLVVHTALIRVCRNKVLVKTAETFLKVNDDNVSRSARDNAWNDKLLPQEWLGHHETIANAVMERNPDKATAASKIHLVSVLLNIETSMSLQDAERERVSKMIERHQ